MNRIDRLFGILTLLQSRKFVPAETIAQKFGISVRTVYRDVKALCEQGIPVSFEQNRGYFIVAGYFLPPVAFSSEEANAMLLMETLVAGFADRSIRKHYSSALSKIKTVLRGPQKESIELLTQNMHFQFPASLRNDAEYLSEIQSSISGRTILEMEYSNAGTQSSRRQVEPVGLVFYAFNWHLIAWCHLRGEYRDFKVSRIKSLQNTGKPFTKKDHIELSAYISNLPVCY